jgi:hypothetical protein
MLTEASPRKPTESAKSDTDPIAAAVANFDPEMAEIEQGDEQDWLSEGLFYQFRMPLG